MAGIVGKISSNISDMKSLGPGVIVRHLARMRPSRTAAINLPGFTPMSVRAGGSDFNALRQVFVNHEYDTSFNAALDQRVKARYKEILAAGETPIIADIGANIGAASVWFGGLYPEARIVAVEPEADNYAMLCQNVSANKNITTIEAAIGAEPGFVSLNTDGESWAVTTTRAESGIRIISMEDALKAAGGDTPFIIKIDIEGFEADLFQKNLDWIDKAYVVIIEPHDWMMPGEFTSRSFQRAMAAHDFEMFLSGENLIYARG